MMSLIDDFQTGCTLLERKRRTDGEGGWITTWEDGPAFTAAIVMDNSTVARVAQHDGMTAVYTVTVDKGMPLDFHDVFRRDSDGQLFRVTSDPTDKTTPDRAGFQFSQVSAEEWRLS